MDQKTFIKTLRSWQNGSISRREFLGRTGLGIAAAVVATNMPGLLTSTAHAAEQAKLVLELTNMGAVLKSFDSVGAAFPHA